MHSLKLCSSPLSPGLRDPSTDQPCRDLVAVTAPSCTEKPTALVGHRSPQQPPSTQQHLTPPQAPSACSAPSGSSLGPSQGRSGGSLRAAGVQSPVELPREVPAAPAAPPCPPGQGQLGTERCWGPTQHIRFLLPPAGPWLLPKGTDPAAGWTWGFTPPPCLAAAGPR